jgi:hypothetical protein
MNFLEKYVKKKLYKPHLSKESEGALANESLREHQLKEVDRIIRNAMIYSAIAGALAVILCYVPYHLFGPDVFQITPVWIPFYEDYIELEISFLVFSMILLVAEIAFLTYNNIKMVNKISHICEFPNENDPFAELNIQSLIATSFEKKIKAQKDIGINPFSGLSKMSLFLYTAFNLAKAALTNFIFKIFIRRILGRYAIRMVVDLAGIPIYAFWNAFATRKVAREAKTRILANPLILKFTEELFKEQKDNIEFKNEIYHLLEYISVIKRDYNINHYILAISLLKKFSLPVEKNRNFDKDTLNRVGQSSTLTKEGFSKLLLVGLALDGVISEKEMVIIYQLEKRGVFLFSIKDAEEYTKGFYSGKVVMPAINH